MTSEIIDIFDVQIEAPEQFGVVVEQTEVNLEPLTITENGVYTPQGSATGFSKVEANVLPKSTDIVITENGEYYPNDYEVDAFSKVGVDVKPKLEEITATDNGTYTPSEGFDGFGKVNVDLKGKVKVNTFKVTNDCLNEEGRWEGDELIDTSSCTSLYLCFDGCSNLIEVNSTYWNTSNVTQMYRLFNNCNALVRVDTTNWDCSNVTSYNQMFYNNNLVSIIGNKTIEEVLNNNIGCLNGLRVNCLFSQSRSLDRASLRAVINGLADLSDTTTQTLTLGATLRAKLTEEDIAIATAKNWTIA